MLSSLLLIVILLSEVLGAQSLGSILPSPIDPNNARIILQRLIAFDGVFLGSETIAFTSLTGRETTFGRISYLLPSIIATVLLLSVSDANACFGLASVSQAGLRPSLFMAPFGLMIYGTTTFFFKLYVQIVRVYLLDQTRV